MDITVMQTPKKNWCLLCLHVQFCCKNCCLELYHFKRSHVDMISLDCSKLYFFCKWVMVCSLSNLLSFKAVNWRKSLWSLLSLISRWVFHWSWFIPCWVTTSTSSLVLQPHNSVATAAAEYIRWRSSVIVEVGIEAFMSQTVSLISSQEHAAVLAIFF